MKLVLLAFALVLASCSKTGPVPPEPPVDALAKPFTIEQGALKVEATPKAGVLEKDLEATKAKIEMAVETLERGL